MNDFNIYRHDTVITKGLFDDITFFDSLNLILRLLLYIFIAISIAIIIVNIKTHIKKKIKNNYFTRICFYIMTLLIILGISISIYLKINIYELLTIYRKYLLGTIICIFIIFIIGYLNNSNNKLYQITTLIFGILAGMRNSLLIFRNIDYDIFNVKPKFYISLYLLTSMFITIIICYFLYMINKKLTKNNKDNKNEDLLILINQILLLLFMIF